MTRLATMRSNLVYLDKQIEVDTTLSNELEKKQKAVKKLTDKHISTPIELNEVNIQLLEQQIELEKNIATNIAIQRAIHTLTTY